MSPDAQVFTFTTRELPVEPADPAALRGAGSGCPPRLFPAAGSPSTGLAGDPATYPTWPLPAGADDPFPCLTDPALEVRAA